MKKLLTIALAFGAFLTFSVSADAQVRRNGNQQPQNNRANNQVVRVYNETKIVRQGRNQFRETHQITVFRNGRTTSRLISRVQINNNRVNNNRNNNAILRTTRQTQTVRKGRFNYRETYQVTTYRNGRVERRLISSVRI